MLDLLQVKDCQLLTWMAPTCHASMQLKQAGVQVVAPSPPPVGWGVVTEENYRKISEKIPILLPGRLPRTSCHLLIQRTQTLLHRLYIHTSKFYLPLSLSPLSLRFLFLFLYYQHFPGMLNLYLAEGVGHSAGKGTFRALSQGYVHWASGQMETLEVNYCNAIFCHAMSDVQ